MTAGGRRFRTITAILPQVTLAGVTLTGMALTGMVLTGMALTGMVLCDAACAERVLEPTRR